MLDISNFLQKFLNLEKDNNTKILSIIDTIKTITGIDLNREDIEIKGDQIKIKCNPVFRNEIFMNKDFIIDNLKSKKIYLNIV